MIGNRKPFKLVDETPTLVDGEHEENSVTVYRGWGEFGKSTGSNYSMRSVLNNQTQIDKFFEVRFRFRDDISVNANTKLIYNGNKYTVTGIRRDNEKRFYWILNVQARDFN